MQQFKYCFIDNAEDELNDIFLFCVTFFFFLCYSEIYADKIYLFYSSGSGDNSS